MGTYTTPALVRDQLKLVSTAVVPDALLNVFITKAGQRIDGYLGERYVVPIPSPYDPIPTPWVGPMGLLESIATDLAVAMALTYTLSDRYLQTDTVGPWVPFEKRAMLDLTRIVERNLFVDILLPVGTTADTAPTQYVGSTEASTYPRVDVLIAAFDQQTGAPLTAYELALLQQSQP